MSAIVQSRKMILDRVRAAIQHPGKDLADAAVEYSALPHNYTRRGSLSTAARLQLLIDRLREYDAEVLECNAGELPAVIAAQLAASGRHTFVAPARLPADWLAPGYEWRLDHGLNTAEIEEAEGVVTAASCAVADSGTIVIHHTAAEGRRGLTLLPDWHLCILRASQVVEVLPEYFDRCRQQPNSHSSEEDLSMVTPALATYISGPSATADIEMTRIKGVHGPRFLHVILVREQG